MLKPVNIKYKISTEPFQMKKNGKGMGLNRNRKYLKPGAYLNNSLKIYLELIKKCQR